METVRTRVGIVGAGPAGLMLSHLLAEAGIDSVVVENRTRETIAATHRAGILEPGSVAMLATSGVESRVLDEGHRHDGIDLRFEGESHRIDLREATGESVWLYPQNEVFVDLASARERAGGGVLYGVSDTRVSQLDEPTIEVVTAEGTPLRIAADYLVGADGSRGPSRATIPEAHRRRSSHEYPFAWFGILTQAPPSAPELIYARSERGFALISQRSATVQRMYFQCPPGTDPAAWSEDRIWSELEARMEGLALKTGPIIDASVLPFRSSVTTPMRYERLLLAGDAAHTVPPTGAKGLNLAFADVAVLFPALRAALLHGDPALLDRYSETALRRVWRAQHFSSWMTSMLHNRDGESDFERQRTLGELRTLVDSAAGRRYLAEGYTGWPHMHRKEGLS